MRVSKNFGEFFKSKRREMGLSLREFCRINGHCPGNLSKIERGLLPPPQTRETQLHYAKSLDIKEGTDEFLNFCDLASTSAGKIPPDFVSNEELINHLPVLFRSARKGMTVEEFTKLTEAVRNELK